MNAKKMSMDHVIGFANNEKPFKAVNPKWIFPHKKLIGNKLQSA